MKQTPPPKITFGIIVLNGEPFTQYNLRALYPFAHQIVVVEGACPSAAPFATHDGHSQDGTLEVLRRFQREEDPTGKIKVVTAEDEGRPDGFWSEKDEMSQAYAKRATGNYLWQVDMDEFYRADDMARVIALLTQRPDITTITFQVRTFWGSLHSMTDGIFLRRGAQNFHRLFAWGPGYRYIRHRPPTVADAAGHDLRRLRAVSGVQMAKRGIYLYHYSFLFPFQADFKQTYYGTMDRNQGLMLQDRREAWRRNFQRLTNPFLIDDTSVLGEPSWLVQFSERHPEAIQQLWADSQEGKLSVQRRTVEDIDRLLRRPGYRLLTRILPILWLPREGVELILSLLRRVRRRLRIIPSRSESRCP